MNSNDLLNVGTISFSGTGFLSDSDFAVDGILVRTSESNYTGRTITGTASEVTMVNGDGVSGNPVVSLPSNLDLTSKTTSVATPSQSSHATTKQYVDDLIAGIASRTTVTLASTANVSLTTGLENGDTIDGVVMVTGDTVLLKDQTDTAANGIYDVVASGTATRNSAFDEYDDYPGAFFIVQEGTTNDDTMWICGSNVGGTIDVTALNFVAVFPGSGGTVTSITAGDGLSGGTISTSGTIAVTFATNPGMEISGSALTAKVGSTLSLGASGIDINLTNDNSWTGSQRGTFVVVTDGTIDMAAGNNFKYTPGATDVLDFSNEANGQSGIIHLINTSGNTITLGTEVDADADLATTISEAGTYPLSYYCFDGTNVVVTRGLAVV